MTAQNSTYNIGYPVYGARFVSNGVLVVSGGGGRGQPGLPSKLTALKVDFAKKKPIKRFRELPLDPEDDAPTAMAAANGIIMLGCNESADKIAASGTNHHVRRYMFKDEHLQLSAAVDFDDVADPSVYTKLLALSPDGMTCAVVSSIVPSLVRIVEPMDLSEMYEIQVGREVRDIAFSADGQTLAYVTAESLDVVSIPSGNFTVRKADFGGGLVLSKVRFMDDGTVVVAATLQGQPGATLLKIQVQSGSAKIVAQKQVSQRIVGISAMEIEPKGKWLALSTDDNKVVVFSTANGFAILDVFEGQHQLGVTAIAISPDSKFIASVSAGSTVNVANFKSGGGSFLGLLKKIVINIVVVVAIAALANVAYQNDLHIKAYDFAKQKYAERQALKELQKIESMTMIHDDIVSVTSYTEALDTSTSSIVTGPDTTSVNVVEPSLHVDVYARDAEDVEPEQPEEPSAIETAEEKPTEKVEQKIEAPVTDEDEPEVEVTESVIPTVVESVSKVISTVKEVTTSVPDAKVDVSETTVIKPETIVSTPVQSSEAILSSVSSVSVSSHKVDIPIETTSEESAPVSSHKLDVPVETPIHAETVSLKSVSVSSHKLDIPVETPATVETVSLESASASSHAVDIPEETPVSVEPVSAEPKSVSSHKVDIPLETPATEKTLSKVSSTVSTVEPATSVSEVKSEIVETTTQKPQSSKKESVSLKPISTIKETTSVVTDHSTELVEPRSESEETVLAATISSAETTSIVAKSISVKSVSSAKIPVTSETESENTATPTISTDTISTIAVESDVSTETTSQVGDISSKSTTSISSVAITTISVPVRSSSIDKVSDVSSSSSSSLSSSSSSSEKTSTVPSMTVSSTTSSLSGEMSEKSLKVKYSTSKTTPSSLTVLKSSATDDTVSNSDLPTSSTSQVKPTSTATSTHSEKSEIKKTVTIDGVVYEVVSTLDDETSTSASINTAETTSSDVSSVSTASSEFKTTVEAEFVESTSSQTSVTVVPKETVVSSVPVDTTTKLVSSTIISEPKVTVSSLTAEQKAVTSEKENTSVVHHSVNQDEVVRTRSKSHTSVSVKPTSKTSVPTSSAVETSAVSPSVSIVEESSELSVQTGKPVSETNDIPDSSTYENTGYTTEATTSIQPAPVADAVNETPVEHDEL